MGCSWEGSARALQGQQADESAAGLSGWQRPHRPHRLLLALLGERPRNTIQPPLWGSSAWDYEYVAGTS